MAFNSFAFFGFVACVLAGYFLLNCRWQNRWLLVTSWAFYASWDPRFVGLLIASSCVNYAVARKLAASSEAATRRRLLTGAICFDVGLLVVFKYAGFFVPTLLTLFLAGGGKTDLGLAQILLPVALSFYTFQLIAYVVDVHRGSLVPCRRLETFLLFTSFFPYLVAGPIARGSSLLPQFEEPRRISWLQVRAGSFLVMAGLFKKIGVADAIAPYVAARFESPSACSSFDLVLSLVCYSLQIYCDFSGYSDVARGLGKVMGFEFPVNFQQPYFSRSITEFWQRWHVSLSTWFRDHMFLPVNYALLRRWPEYRMLGLNEEYWSYIVASTLTMLLCGVWHGSQWTFVAWGAAHGILLSAHRILLRIRKPRKRRDRRSSSWLSLAKGTGCFALVTLLWIPFRAPDFLRARDYLAGMVQWRSTGAIEMATLTGIARFGLLASFVLFLDLGQRKTGDEAFLLRQPWIVRGIVYAGFCLVLLVLGGIDAEVPFIYLQF